MKSRKKNVRLFQGFTLIELLVVLGILAVLLGISLIAINPYESLNRANDITAKVLAQDFVNASVQFYTTTKTLPWEDDQTCESELNVGQTLAEMSACTKDLINSGKLEESYKNSSQLKEIYFTKCGKSGVLCYSPKSKIEFEQAEAKYSKFGVNQPGCPGKIGESQDCYWCRPILNDSDCLINLTPTPTPTPTPVPTFTPTPIPTPTPPPFMVGGYKLDDPKFLRTYIILSYDYPSFPPNYMIDISFRPDFGGIRSFSFGYFVNGSPVTSNADTILWVAYAGDGNFYASWAADSVKRHQTDLTSKHFAFISMPYYWSKYVNGCGNTIYWRLADAPIGGSGYTSTKFSQTFMGTVDCTTKVGASTSYSNTDFNGDGVVDWTDYIIASLQTKSRAGGWQPPE